MLKALGTASTGMDAQTKQIETIGNNLANADTTSFKRSRVDFQDLLYQNIKEPGAATSASTQNPTGISIGVGTKVAGTMRDHTDGTLKHTERQLDVAIEGSGFLAFQKPDGEVSYSRDGGLRIGTEGQLTNPDGFPLIPEIQIPPTSKSINVAMDGKVTVTNDQNQQEEVGQIQLTTFANSAGLQAEGGNLYRISPASGAPVPGNPTEAGLGRLFQGYLEASNVNPAREMTDMIRAQRMYELNSKVISTSDQMMNALNNLR